MLSVLSDARLMKLVVDGDHNAFAEIVSRHTDQVFRVVFYSLHNLSDAEDVVQNVFIKLWQKPHLWNPDKSKLSTWLHRVAINACHDLRRRNSKSVDIEDESLNRLIESEALQTVPQESNTWQLECLEYAISRLSQKQRDVINLVVYAELSQREAADVLGINLKALESLLLRAKRKISDIVKRQSGKAASNNDEVRVMPKPELNNVPQ